MIPRFSKETQWRFVSSISKQRIPRFLKANGWRFVPALADKDCAAGFHDSPKTGPGTLFSE